MMFDVLVMCSCVPFASMAGPSTFCFLVKKVDDSVFNGGEMTLFDVLLISGAVKNLVDAALLALIEPSLLDLM